MHNAPSVSYPVGRSRFAAALAAVLWLAGVAVTVAWAMQPAVHGWGLALGVAALVAAAGAAMAHGLRAPVGELRWDGAGWCWRGEGGETAGQPSLALDLQHVMLLRWSGEAGPAVWLWLERVRAPGDWPALRRAVYSRARKESPPRSETSPAEP